MTDNTPHICPHCGYGTHDDRFQFSPAPAWRRWLTITLRRPIPEAGRHFVVIEDGKLVWKWRNG